MIKLTYIVIPVAAFLTAAIGGWLTGTGMDWYKTINIPSWTPPGSTIGMVWTIIFILTAASAIMAINKGQNIRILIILFTLNALLNIFWSFLFFNQHLIGTAAVEAALLGASVISLIVIISPISKIAAILLVPYAGWVIFATYLTYTVWMLNK